MKNKRCISLDAAQHVSDRYRGLWGFVDRRVHIAVIRSAIIFELSIDDSCYDDQSANWLIDKLKTWESEVIELLASKYMLLLGQE